MTNLIPAGLSMFAAIALAAGACGGNADPVASGPGGAAGVGGSSNSSSSSGQASSSSSSGSTGSGGGAVGAGGAGGGGVTDPDAVARVDGWIEQLPYGQQALSPTQRSQIVDAIIKSCVEFGPAGADWQKYCQATIVSAILKESSYDPSSVVTDSYATRAVPTGAANDPTVGLLQIRFSSTVNDYNSFGPLPSMAAIGCPFPDLGHAAEGGDSDFWAVTGPTANLALMQSIPCNVGLATWYYFINATGNGGPTPVYAYQYCQGQGVAADVIVGLLSHLQGPGGPHPPDPTNPYVTFIEGWFTTFLGSVAPDPFTATLSPDTKKYCR